jgi:maltose alpha-D-glucosyltransferase / alpha-amylase
MTRGVGAVGYRAQRDRQRRSAGDELRTSCRGSRCPVVEMSATRQQRGEAVENRRWFQHAVFYEVFLRGFYDSNNDGVGDIRGLHEKLDYLQWLGVDAVWLLPFYPSPMRDGGYDISDFFNVAPDYGTLADLTRLLDDAHRRGIRFVADLVMNHTSDAHPWFIESRSSHTNPKADWYVWNDDDQRWPEARVVFTDVERSNWTWDDTRQQYYWHRFYSHQPDLNYENPEVADTMIDMVRFWLEVGFDGFRLDAAPYLFQRDGTAGEHLPETHEFLKRLRKEIEASYPGRILLAEANGWPADVADYFGDGDECHLAFHFPLMPRIYMAVRKEQRYPVTEILSQTPEIPDGCQWAIFLRNHDELTLEQVTEEERDYLFGEYAKDPRMKRHMGIGRRLAPLLDGDRRLAELLYALLLSMPGSPVIYYGDELLMGDNIYLGDRDSVRTPMQWSPDRNGGFSKADFAALYLPPVMDPVYGADAVNVEAQCRNPGSFLHWLRGMLVQRRSLPVLGIGSLDQVACPDPSVLAYVRSGVVADLPQSADRAFSELRLPSPAIPGLVPPTVPAWGSPVRRSVVPVEPGDREQLSGVRTQAVLCVHNLSRFAQPAPLSLAKWAGLTPVEVLGRVPFPVPTDEPYNITLAPYGFMWFELVDDWVAPEDRTG